MAMFGAVLEHRLFDHVERLLRLRWFHRVWVIQEVALARAVRLHVGSADVVLSAKTVARLQLLYNPDKSKDKLLPGPLRWTPETREQTDLFACLCATRDCYASDARDPVFGILSLVSEEVQSLIPVDYSLDLITIYTRAAAAIIAQQCSLAVLAHPLIKSRASMFWEEENPEQEGAPRRARIASGLGSVPRDITGWPSWVPEWRRLDTYRYQIPDQFTGTTYNSWKSRVFLSSSTGSRTHSMKEASASPVFYSSIPGEPQSLFSHCLTVRAHILDTLIGHDRFDLVSALQYARFSKDYWDNVAELRHSDCFQFSSIAPYSTVSWHWDYEVPSEYLYIFYGGRSPRSYTFAGAFSKHLEVLTRFPSMKDQVKGRHIYPPQKSEVFGYTEPYDAFLSAAGKVGTTFYVFRTKHSLGFASYGSGYMHGDVVVALDAAPAPFILRSVGEDKYTIVCDCYLMGALEYDDWKKKGGIGPWGELPDDIASNWVVGLAWLDHQEPNFMA